MLIVIIAMGLSPCDKVQRVYRSGFSGAIQRRTARHRHKKIQYRDYFFETRETRDIVVDREKVHQGELFGETSLFPK